MRIVPENKQDFEACSALSAADDPAVVAQLDALLAWLQDMIRALSWAGHPEQAAALF